ncbi:hypothetical protein [Streptomyces lancefieldiae]|uniref:Uncharacterized protein n=1 Tax=Streptomyces lancefieldiae TaxID=3075520 RepID=A0ABU3B2Q6_9ACTN|nr:hypothetical protein [Streptomyces sp. DSM 40712]MDT0616127.1 hypothetical protein [Streptomyces sp. DSM 40712]
MQQSRISCPGSAAGLFIVLGERGFFSTSGDYALSDDDLETKPLLPADPIGLTGIGRRLHGVALADGQSRQHLENQGATTRVPPREPTRTAATGYGQVTGATLAREQVPAPHGWTKTHTEQQAVG